MGSQQPDVDINDITTLINRWYYSEIRDIAQAAIDACRGTEVTLERAKTRGHFGSVSRAHLASAMASFVPYVDTASRERPPGIDPREYLTEWLDETIDGHEFVIYTYRNRLVAAATDNADAYEDETGGVAKPEVIAFHAMRADVWEELERRTDEWEIDEGK